MNNECLNKSFTKEIKDSIIIKAIHIGENNIDEVIHNIEQELDRINSPQIKAMLGTLVWTHCPIEVQLACIKLHYELLLTYKERIP